MNGSRTPQRQQAMVKNLHEKNIKLLQPSINKTISTGDILCNQNILNKMVIVFEFHTIIHNNTFMLSISKQMQHQILKGKRAENSALTELKLCPLATEFRSLPTRPTQL